MHSRELFLEGAFFISLLSELQITLFFHNPVFIVTYVTICVFCKCLPDKAFPKLSKYIIIHKQYITYFTSHFSIKVSGLTNCVKVNGKIMTSTTDSINTNNKISVSGEGNTVSVIQNDRKADVNIKQEGTHNQAIISQRK